mgnify:CR=1 FL=1
MNANVIQIHNRCKNKHCFSLWSKSVHFSDIKLLLFWKFAISLKNVGAPLEYSGDGISLEMLNPNTGILITSEQRVSSFEFQQGMQSL